MHSCTVESFTQLKNYPTYSVSSSGQVKNKLSGKLIKQSITPLGTHRVNLTFNNKENNKQRKSVPVYRLVGETFLPNPNNHKWIKHKDGNLSNNAVNNLEWVQRQPKR